MPIFTTKTSICNTLPEIKCSYVIEGRFIITQSYLNPCIQVASFAPLTLHTFFLIISCPKTDNVFVLLIDAKIIFLKHFHQFFTVLVGCVKLYCMQSYQSMKILSSFTLLHPVSVPRWGPLDSLGKMSNFQTFFGVKPSSKFSLGR